MTRAAKPDGAAPAPVACQPRRARGKFSAGVVVLRRFDGVWHCLMLRAYKNWDFPKGEVEPGEQALAAARREVQEETSLTALDFRWGEAYCETAPYAAGKVARYYLAECVQGDAGLPINEALGRPEHHEFRWVDFATAQRLAPPRLQNIVAWAQSLIPR
jgi:8-oxo-dGTP pyrophosphatase MutT (NUDIX family)